MPDTHALTIQSLIKWLERQDDISKVAADNYEELAAVGDKWDIPMLLHDIDVYSSSLLTNSRCFFA
jgi:hypothetical protein